MVQWKERDGVSKGYFITKNVLFNNKMYSLLRHYGHYSNSKTQFTINALSVTDKNNISRCQVRQKVQDFYHSFQRG